MNAPETEVRVGPALLPDGTGPVEVVVRDGRIMQVVETDSAAARHRYLAPGLIDIQVNGYGGIGFGRADLTVADVRRVVDRLAAEGVTRLVPTLVTGAHATYVAALRALAAACEQDRRVRNAVVCLHVEGPWIAPEDGPRGAHPLAHVRPPDPAEFDAWQEAAGGRIGYVTLAPEVDGALSMIERLAAAGIVVAIGHTGATADRIQAAVNAGAKLSTHLGNGAHATVPRHDNYIWAQLGDDRLWASFIADGHHLPGPVLQSMIRAKTPARSILISDATQLAGMPPGHYQDFGVDVEIRPDGRLCLRGTPYLAGSAQSLLHCVATAPRITDLSLAQAIEMASANPAALFGISGESGRLEPQMRADLIEFDWNPAADTAITVRRTMAAGEVTYERN